jgi:hypothetical protein
VHHKIELHFNVLPCRKGWETLAMYKVSSLQNRPWRPRGRVEVYSTLPLTLTLDGVGGQYHAPAALPLGKRHGTHCTGGWVGSRASLDGCRKSRTHWGLIPRPSSPQKVAIPISYPRPWRYTGLDCKQRIYFQCIPYWGHLYIIGAHLHLTCSYSMVWQHCGKTFDIFKGIEMVNSLVQTVHSILVNW